MAHQSSEASPKLVLHVDPLHDVVVVVPTVAHRDTLLPTVRRLVADAKHESEGEDPIRVGIVLSINPPDLEDARGVADDARLIASVAGVDLAVYLAERPIGFSAANNRGLIAAINEWGGCADLVIFHNDDAHVPLGFARRMLAAIRTEIVHGYSEHFTGPRMLRPDRPASAVGRIGLVGPLSNLVAGIQQIDELEIGPKKYAYKGNVEAFDNAISVRFEGQRVTADFLSGFCVGLRREAIADLMLYRETIDADLANAIGPWDEDGYPIAGYEDNDLCVRAELAGWRCVVAADLFVGHVGHQTFDRLFPEMLRGMRNRQAYYDRWSHLTQPADGHRIGAVYRLRFEVAHDIQLFRLSAMRTAELADSITILLTSNPLDVLEDVRWPVERGLLAPEDDEMLRACDGADADRVGAVLRLWIARVIASRSNRLGSTADEVAEKIAVDVWTAETLDERAERNRSIELAEDRFAPTWILSVDHDEVVENRITRDHFDRLCSHPDPLVRAYDQSWVNHWDSERNYRVDRPWGDGGTWMGGMHGYRLFRTGGHRRIFAGSTNGLHCGNVPDHDSTAKRISGVRFRHFGYLRAEDRIRKHQRYQEQDPTPDAALTGNTGRDAYSHIIHDTEMVLSPFSPMTGIGLHVLMHPGERVDDLARLLDLLHGLVDRVVLVWTAPWTAEDQDLALLPAAPEDAAKQRARDELRERFFSAAPDPRLKEPRRLIASRRARRLAERTATGPSPEVLAISRAFGAEWIHHELQNDLAAARNAGLDALALRAVGIGWSLFFDLDEHFVEPFGALVAIRRMAEAVDTDAWLFGFANVHNDGTRTRSESYRMARLLPQMYLRGRVHETFDAALGALDAAGRTPRTRQAPFDVIHTGLGKSDEEMDRKLARYREMLLLELRDRPYNAAAWVALGLALENEGNVPQAEECYQRGVLCPDSGYLAFRELGMFLLRQATPLLAEAMQRSRNTAWNRANDGMVRYLLANVPPLPLLGSARTGNPVAGEPIVLPDFVPVGDSDLIG